MQEQKIVIRHERCNDCGLCLDAVGGYCIDRVDGKLQIDRAVCNQCLRCVAICPRQVFTLDGKEPGRADALRIDEKDFLQLVRSRRSVKAFKDKPVPRDVLRRIAEASRFAPTMNKAIALVVIDDQDMIRRVDAEAMRHVRRWYRMLFGSRMFTRFFELFSDALPTVKKKMERDLVTRGKVIKENTQALIVVHGNRRVPVTESSGQYYLALMTYYAQVLGVGTTLMDSLKLTLNRSRSMRGQMGLPKKNSVLGVLALGYPKERFINIPEGIEIQISWNSGKPAPPNNPR